MNDDTKSLVHLIFAYIRRDITNEATRASASNAISCIESALLTDHEAYRMRNINKAAQYLWGAYPPKGWKLNNDWTYSKI